MAATSLIAYTEGFDESTAQSVGQGEVHTILPIFRTLKGAVVIKAVLADDSTLILGRLTTRPSSNKMYQLQGPLEYIVEVKNAGVDVDTGT